MGPEKNLKTFLGKLYCSHDSKVVQQITEQMKTRMTWITHELIS